MYFVKPRKSNINKRRVYHFAKIKGLTAVLRPWTHGWKLINRFLFQINWLVSVSIIEALLLNRFISWFSAVLAHNKRFLWVILCIIIWYNSREVICVGVFPIKLQVQVFIKKHSDASVYLWVFAIVCLPKDNRQEIFKNRIIYCCKNYGNNTNSNIGWISSNNKGNSRETILQDLNPF